MVIPILMVVLRPFVPRLAAIATRCSFRRLSARGSHHCGPQPATQARLFGAVFLLNEAFFEGERHATMHPTAGAWVVPTNAQGSNMRR